MTRADADERVRVDAAHTGEIAQFLYDEAALLDDRCWEAWLDLLAPDLRYWMPARSNRILSDADRETAHHDEVAHFDDTRDDMIARVRRLRTGFAWSEDPPSRTRHLVTNVRAWEAPQPDEFDVESAFLVYQNRHERDAHSFAGRRSDRIRRRGDSFEIARRTILLDQTLITAPSLSILF